MARLALSAAARADLDDVWHYIAIESGDFRADAYLERIYSVFSLICDQPLVGRVRPELVPDLRSFPAAAHIVYYLPGVDVVHVVRVLHASRDVQSVF